MNTKSGNETLSGQVMRIRFNSHPRSGLRLAFMALIILALSAGSWMVWSRIISSSQNAVCRTGQESGGVECLADFEASGIVELNAYAQIAVSRNGDLVVGLDGGSDKSSLIGWSTRDKNIAWQVPTTIKGTELALSPQNDKVAIVTGREADNLTILRIPDGAVIAKGGGPSETSLTSDIVFQPDGNSVVFGQAKDRRVAHITGETLSGTDAAPFAGGTCYGPVGSSNIGFIKSHDGDLSIIISDSRGVYGATKEILTLKGLNDMGCDSTRLGLFSAPVKDQTNDLTHMRFSPDDRYFAAFFRATDMDRSSGSDQIAIRAFNRVQLLDSWTILNLRGRISSSAWAPDGSALAILYAPEAGWLARLTNARPTPRIRVYTVK